MKRNCVTPKVYTIDELQFSTHLGRYHVRSNRWTANMALIATSVVDVTCSSCGLRYSNCQAPAGFLDGGERQPMRVYRCLVRTSEEESRKIYNTAIFSGL